MSTKGWIIFGILLSASVIILTLWVFRSDLRPTLVSWAVAVSISIVSAIVFLRRSQEEGEDSVSDDDKPEPWPGTPPIENERDAVLLDQEVLNDPVSNSGSTDDYWRELDSRGVRAPQD